MSGNDDKIMNHDYDGIRELDNDMPPWWLWLFYITIIWAVGYMLYYHVFGWGDLQIAEYNKEMDPNWVATAEGPDRASFFYRSPFYDRDEELTPRLERERLEAEQLALEQETRRQEALARAERGAEPGVSLAQLRFDDLILEAMRKAGPEDLEKLQNAFPQIYAALADEGMDMQPAAAESPAGTVAASYTALMDEASLAAGNSIYQKNCASCHGNAGQGGIGPNLTDDYWIHGGGIDNVVHITKVGVPAKGMIAWQPILSEQEILQVSSYILNLRGTNPPNAKAPQGEKLDDPL